MNFSKSILLIALVILPLASCNNLGANYNRSMEAFEFSENCPNGCFLGIKPLATTAKDALHILQNSPDIDHSTIYILYDNGNELAKNIDDSSLTLMKNDGILEAVWTPTSNKEFGLYVHITATNDLVDYIDAVPISKTIQDFTDIIGEPDKIQAGGELTPDGGYLVSYSLYYSKWKFLIFNLFGGTIDGPKPDDHVSDVVFNQEITEADFVEWQGYGRMKLYMTPSDLRDYQKYTPGASDINP